MDRGPSAKLSHVLRSCLIDLVQEPSRHTAEAIRSGRAFSDYQRPEELSEGNKAKTRNDQVPTAIVNPAGVSRDWRAPDKADEPPAPQDATDALHLRTRSSARPYATSPSTSTPTTAATGRTGHCPPSRATGHARPALAYWRRTRSAAPLQVLLRMVPAPESIMWTAVMAR